MFDFSKRYVLEDEIVKLIPLSISNVNDLLEISKEPGIWDYSFIKGDGKDNLTSYFQATILNREKGVDYPFVVFDKRTNEFAGSTRFCEYIAKLDSIRVGYTWYGEKFRGTRLNKHCKYLMFKFAFEEIGVERIGLGAYQENTVSIKAMESVGCKKEGVFRNLFPSLDGRGRTDAILMSILKEEWFSSVKGCLENKLIKR